MTAFLYLLVLTQLKIETGGSLTDAGKDLAVLAEYSDTAGGMGSTAAVILYGKQEVKAALSGKVAAAVLKDGADGLSLLGSSWVRKSP